MTDGSSTGALPQIDVTDPAQPKPNNVLGPGSASDRAPAADFLPSAFADPFTATCRFIGASSRGATAAIPYNVFGVNLQD